MNKTNKSILELKTHFNFNWKKEIKVIKGKKHTDGINSKMVDLKSTKLIITLKINGLNTLVTRQITSENIQNQEPIKWNLF